MDASAVVGFRQRPVWLLAILALLAGQGCLTLRLFGTDSPWRRLADDEPVLSGRHPLHLYHGFLGARNWLERGTTSCFDPAFQAGYPKTPVFDGGSRPAELFLLATGGEYRPAAYKIGLALCCLLAPLAFVAAARGLALPNRTACLAGLIGACLWWSPPVQNLLEAGDLGLLLAGLCALVHLCWLVRYARWPGVDSWLMVAGTACVGWYAQPLLWAVTLPLALVYYLWVAARHGLHWHLALFGAGLLGALVNALWLWDWLRYAWIRMPTGPGPSPVPPLAALAGGDWLAGWEAQPFFALVGLVGMLGLVTLFRRRERAAAAMLAVCAAAVLLLVRLGRAWPPLEELGLAGLFPLAAWALVCPCAAFLAAVAGSIGRKTASPPFGAMLVLLGLGAAVGASGLGREALTRPGLVVGLDAERQTTIATLTTATEPNARILWEESADDRPGSDWSALLPLLTGRDFLGGLDPNAGVEHMFARLADGVLAGRPVDRWSDAELAHFGERYNVGWVACRSAAALKRFADFPAARPVAELPDGGRLFALGRTPSFFLKGQGRWVQGDRQRIALADVVPENGEVVLSLHYQSGWRVAPSYVQIERDLDPFDPIPFIRLRMPGPVARLTLTWENP